MQILTSAVRELTGVSRTVIMLMVLMHVVVTVAIVLVEMTFPAMVISTDMSDSSTYMYARIVDGIHIVAW